MKAWTAVHLAGFQQGRLHFGRPLGIFSAMLAHRAGFPGRRAALGNLKGLAEQGDRGLRAVLGNELNFHRWLREKMPIGLSVFF
ncbi:MAG: hypothetical protein AUH89_01225 [Ktedonobacter sp. 13_1_40CM_4_52_4]|nr:MAG: hypothetical protein AUH89_01225 [Ktedonobacter sp. 13_1_40CM_4_52_4]